MSQSYPPQPPQGGNPYGQQQPQYGVPPQGGNPFGQQPQQPGGFGGGYPPPAPLPPARNNAGLGILVGAAAAIVLALAYGGFLRATSKDDGSFSEFRLVAMVIGALVGLAIAKAGGRNAMLPVIAIPLALFAVIFGELFGMTLVISHMADQQGVAGYGVTDILFHHFGDLIDSWKEDFGFKRGLFLFFGGFIAFALAKRVSDSS